MSQLPGDQLRQVKWLLVGILACLILIVCALLPGLVSAALFALVVYAAIHLVLSVSKTAREGARRTWLEVASFLRR